MLVIVVLIYIASFLLLYFIPGFSVTMAVFGSVDNISPSNAFIYLILLSFATSIGIDILLGTFFSSIWLILPGYYLFTSSYIIGSIALIIMISSIVWVFTRNSHGKGFSIDTEPEFWEIEKLRKEYDEVQDINKKLEIKEEISEKIKKLEKKLY
ncbi:MAG: hypothetical protein ACP5RS_05460 [Thermoplasmata archaeon]